MMLVANVLIIKYTINNIDAWTTERTLLFWCRVIEWSVIMNMSMLV